MSNQNKINKDKTDLFINELANLHPSSTAVSRDKVMFEAGRQSVLCELAQTENSLPQQRKSYWPIVAAASLMLATTLGFMLIDQSREFVSYSAQQEEYRLDRIGTEMARLEQGRDELPASQIAEQDYEPKLGALVVSTSEIDRLPESADLTPALFLEWRQNRDSVGLPVEKIQHQRSQATYAELTDELLEILHFSTGETSL